MTNNAANDAPINKVEDLDDPVLPLKRAGLRLGAVNTGCCPEAANRQATIRFYALLTWRYGAG